MSDSLIGLLEPVANQDWHGKWRINKALEILRQHQADHVADAGKMIEPLTGNETEGQ